MLSVLLVIAALQSTAADPNLASVQKQLRADDQALLDANPPTCSSCLDIRAIEKYSGAMPATKSSILLIGEKARI